MQEKLSNTNEKFSIVPTESELNSINRDLRFYEVSNANPIALTPAQVEQYNSQGYVAPLDVFSDVEIQRIRQYFDRLLVQVVAEGGDSYSISSAHLSYGPVYDLLTERRIVDFVADLLGDDVIGWGSHFFCKMPGDGRAVAWHQDASYWPLTPSKVVTVWLAVDDADPENACMKFIAGSHHHGHLTYRESDPNEHNVLNQTIENPEQFGRIVFDQLKAGQISMHSDLLLHGSEANGSSRRRCGLTLRYASAEVKASLGWHEKGVVVRGTDKASQWSHNSRPNG